MIPSHLRGVLSANDHLVEYETVLLAGLSPNELRALVSRGELVRVRHGVFTTADHWTTLTTVPQRELLRARAASMCLAVPHVLSHDSAAHALGLTFLLPLKPLIHVTRAQTVGSRTRAGVKHHAATYQPSEVRRVGVLDVLDAPRTAIDLAREHGLRTGVTACDAALRGGATKEQLLGALDVMTRWRGVSAAKAAVTHADPGAENPAESLARLLVIEAGFGVPQTQYPVRLGNRVVWVDLLIAAHVIEFDGRLKYRRVENGGVTTSDASDVVWKERQRELALLGLGLGVSRLIWDDLLPRNWSRTRERLAREIGASVARTGAIIPAHLQSFAATMATERERRVFGRP